MKSPVEIKQLAINTLSIEAEAVRNLIHNITDDFASCVKAIYESEGRVIVTGIGKSAIIASKIVSTLNSTGTPAVFMHAADAIHGDLGTIRKEDIIICLSKSGNTPEINVLVPLLRNGGNKLIAFTGNTGSYLALQADYIINCSVEKEACPNNLAPTSSTTAQLAMGDALAVCLLSCREFSSRDFARYHPGGQLGKRLYLKVSDLSLHNTRPRVSPDDPVKSVIIEISSNRLGAAAVLDQNEKLTGVITDGDIRRMLEKHDRIGDLKAGDIMNKTPKSIEADELAIKAVEIIRRHNISQLVVMRNGSFEGFIHVHDLLREGLI